MKLEKKIILSIMGGMLLGFTAFLSINYSMMYETTSTEIYDKLKGKSADLTRDIEEWLGDKQRTALALARRAQNLQDRSPANVRNYLYLVNQSANIDASMVYYKGQTLIHTEPDWALTPQEEEANMPYQTMLANGFNPTISKVFKSPINKIDNMVAAIAPFNGDSVATLVVEIKDVEEKVSSSNLDGGFAALIDVDRRLLVDPNPNFIGKKISEFNPELGWMEEKIFALKSGYIEYLVKGKFIWLFLIRLNLQDGKWYSTLKKETAFANLTVQTKKLILISVIFFILGAIFIVIINILHEYWRREIELKRDEYEFILAHRSRISEIGELISGINHQLHQPLNSLSLLSSSMLSKSKNKTLTSEVLEENLIMSQKAIALMSTTIGMFRNFYRFDGNATTFCLKQCIDGVLQVLYIDFSRHNISVEIDCDRCDMLNITSVDNFIQQVLLVLLQNAKEALLMTNDRIDNKIQIHVSLDGELVNVDIADWGEGISKAIEEKLFDNIKSSKKTLGSGIGLYFARKLAREKLKGDLVLVQSSMPTIFRFSFKNYLSPKEQNDASANA
ncbi:ATP-binding protein [Sulfurospirillum diekertiae]|uniref:ATP-binding protein n=1 Tax=Sulfurospirillum diekertiae TaxID=1854492 RepID=UPI000B4D96D0|nr:ATP-binding protein [Sulfurospirillum diekertiae]ASC93563.1 hypothetical protein Sdiek2_1545 [Sulfurospirillum diekertiae]